MIECVLISLILYTPPILLEGSASASIQDISAIRQMVPCHLAEKSSALEAGFSWESICHKSHGHVSQTPLLTVQATLALVLQAKILIRHCHIHTC